MGSYLNHCKRLLNNSVALATASLLFICLAGCGSDEKAEAPAITPAKQSDKPAEQKHPESPLRETSASALHDAAVELFAAGISGDDPAAMMQATALFEQAVAAEPDNTAYWVDLADAYMLSDIPVQYPYAIDIYWMLLKEKNSQQDILLGRLADAYFKVDNTPLAFEAALERLKQSKGAQVNVAAYSFAYMALANRSFGQAIKALEDKAESQQDPSYLLLVASLLEEAADNTENALKLIDKAINSSSGDSPLAKLAKNERTRMSP